MCCVSGPSSRHHHRGKLVTNTCRWVSWVIAKLDPNEVGRQTVKVTQHELVSIHDDGEATHEALRGQGLSCSSQLLCVSRLSCFRCRAGMMEGAEPLETSPRRNHVVRLLTMQATGKNQREMTRTLQGINTHQGCLQVVWRCIDCRLKSMCCLIQMLSSYEEDVGHHAIAQHWSCKLRKAAQIYEQVALACNQGKRGVAQPKPLQVFWEPAKI